MVLSDVCMFRLRSTVYLDVSPDLCFGLLYERGYFRDNGNLGPCFFCLFPLQNDGSECHVCIVRVSGCFRIFRITNNFYRNDVDTFFYLIKNKMSGQTGRKLYRSSVLFSKRLAKVQSIYLFAS